MPAANRIGRHRIAYHGQTGAGRAAGEHEQRDLGGGVEPEPEQDSDRVHLGRALDRPGHPAEQPVHEPALIEPALELGFAEAAALHLAQDAQDPDQDHEVQRRDQVQEAAGDERPDRARQVVQSRVVLADGAIDSSDAD